MGIESIDVDSWDEFSVALDDANGRLAGRMSEYGLPVQHLYRGHASTEWRLETTLERSPLGSDTWTTKSYIRLASEIRPELEARTGQRFDVPAWHEVAAEIARLENHRVEDDRCSQPRRLALPGYDYLVYLRQMGFPSPLLDWSRSPYVAAFFALRKPESDRVAIYVYSEQPNGAKGWVGGHPLVQPMFGGGRNHARHYQQQAAYTVAAKWHYDDAEWELCSHERVIEAPEVGRRSQSQDRCVRITIPRSERQNALAWLSTVNISAETLFQTEDAIVESLADRVFVNRPKGKKPEPVSENSDDMGDQGSD